MLPRESGADMKRRDFIAALGGAATLPLAARAQPSERRRVIGLLLPADDGSRQRGVLMALERLGYREGRYFTVEVRSAGGRLERLPSLAHELVRAGVEVIVAFNTPGTQAAIDTKTKIPIVMALVGDPIGSGFVANLNRPGGTVTGAANAVGEIAGKRLALLKEAIPAIRRIAVFTHPHDPVRIPQLRQVEESSRVLDVEIKVCFPRLTQVMMSSAAFGCRLRETPVKSLQFTPGGENLFIRRLVDRIVDQNCNLLSLVNVE